MPFQTRVCRPAFLLALLFSGTGTASALVSVNFNAPDDVGVTAAGFQASGETVEFALNHAPPTGAELMVVNNTALDFITGTFSNLAHGQKVTLIHAGIPYGFVANYYGGTGNDLVLQWAETRVVAWGSNTAGQLGNDSAINQNAPVNVVSTGVLSGKTVTSLSTGRYHSLALCSDGTLAAWGTNLNDVLGNDSTAAFSRVPVGVKMDGILSGKTVVAISAGETYNLALCSDGTLASWGRAVDSSLSRVPVAVNLAGLPPGKRFIAVSAGREHCLGLCADGTVMGWGSNSWGQLGNNSTSPGSLPVPLDTTGVLAGKSVTAVAAGSFHSLALCSDGTVVTWGDNSTSQLGNGIVGTSTYSRVPVAVSTADVLAGKVVVAIAASGAHNVVLCADGTLAAWGYNSNGQLGNQSTENSPVPVAVSRTGALMDKTVKMVAARDTHSMALCSDGTVAAWGSNSGGAIINVLPQGMEERFVRAAGGISYHSLALVASPPRPFLPLVSVSAGALEPTFQSLVENYTLNLPPETDAVSLTFLAQGGMDVVKLNGSAAAPGSPHVISLGYGLNTVALEVTSPDFTGSRTYNFTILRQEAGPVTAHFSAAGDVGLTTEGFTAAGRTVSLSLDFAPRTGTNLRVIDNTSLTPITGAFGNLTHGQTATLTYDGISYPYVANYFGGTGNDLVLQWKAVRAVGWGNNYDGQIGDNTNSLRWYPVDVTSTGVLAGKTVVAVAAGPTHSLALTADGTLAAWGSNRQGCLGNNSFQPSRIPVAVSTTGVLAGKTVMAIAAGSDHCLVLCSDGTMAAWGSNTASKLGRTGSSSSVPVAVPQAGALIGRKVVAICAGENHNLALCSDGIVTAWGSNSSGQLGIGSSPSSSSMVPVLVKAGKVVSISSSREHNVALRADGSIVAWGQNGDGQLGNNSTSSSSLVVEVIRTSVLTGRTVKAVAAGGSHCLALCEDGTLAAWGRNNYGQLGNNTLISSAVPVRVNQSGFLAGKTAVALSIGSGRSSVLCSDGTMASWGWNPDGRLGINSTTDSLVPAAVSRISLAPDEHFSGISPGSFAFGGLALVASPPVELGDPDRDGMIGFAETYFGTNPTVPDGKPWSVRAGGAADGGGTALSLVWPAAAPAGISAVPQWSPDLITWLASGEAAEGIAARTLNVAPGAGNLQEAALDVTGLPRVYLRLKLTRE